MGAPLNFTGNYGLSYNQYQKYSQYSGLEQSGGLNTRWLPGEKTSMTGALSYSSGRGSSIGSGVLENATNLNSSLKVRYQTTGKIDSGVDFGYNTRTYGVNQNYQSQSINLVNDYQVTSKIQIGVGIGAGTRTATATADETDQTAQLRWNYAMSGKMSINGDFGMENRATASASSNWQPRFQSGWQYHLFDGTSLGVSGFRRVDAYTSGTTLNIGQVIGCTGTISQRLLQRMSLNLSGGVETIQRDGVSGASQNRTFFGPSLGFNLLRWLGGSVFWRATSSCGEGSYDQMIYGVQLSAFY